jgi:Protein of unknown function (DUF3037)
MVEGRYSVIRLVPDPARREALNIGIIAWTEREVRVSVDDAAISRAVRDNPHIERDSLHQLEPMLLDRIGSGEKRSANLHTLLGDQTGFPLEIADPRMMNVDAGVDVAVDRLLTRLVRPRRRSSGGSPSPKEQISREIRPLIVNRAVERDRSVAGKVSGTPRVVDFFVNHGMNLALDVVRLAVTRADEVRFRADAEAFKAYDVLSGSEVSNFVAFCTFSQETPLSSANQNARKVLQAAGAEVVTDIHQAAQLLGADPSLLRSTESRRP